MSNRLTRDARAVQQANPGLSFTAARKQAARANSSAISPRLPFPPTGSPAYERWFFDAKYGTFLLGQRPDGSPLGWHLQDGNLLIEESESCRPGDVLHNLAAAALAHPDRYQLAVWDPINRMDWAGVTALDDVITLTTADHVLDEIQRRFRERSAMGNLDHAHEPTPSEQIPRTLVVLIDSIDEIADWRDSRKGREMSGSPFPGSSHSGVAYIAGTTSPGAPRPRQCFFDTSIGGDEASRPGFVRHSSRGGGNHLLHLFDKAR